MTLSAPGGLDDPPFPDDAIEVGRVLGAWGIKGGIRVLPFSKDPQALFSSRRWFIRPPETPLAAPKVAAQSGRLAVLQWCVDQQLPLDGCCANVHAFRVAPGLAGLARLPAHLSRHAPSRKAGGFVVSRLATDGVWR